LNVIGEALVLETGWQKEISFARGVERSVTSTEKNFYLTGPQSFLILKRLNIYCKAYLDWIPRTSRGTTECGQPLIRCCNSVLLFIVVFAVLISFLFHIHRSYRVEAGVYVEDFAGDAGGEVGT
jgi:hypothetical protein